jgi:hypothetical protein
MSKVFKAVGNAVSGVVKAVTKVVSNVVKAVVNVVSSVINFIAQPFMGLLGGMPDMPSASAEADRQQGVLVQTQGSNTAIPIVYGYRKVGGTVVFAETGSTNNKYLYVAYVFSEGLVEGLREVFIDDWLLPVNLTANLNAGQVVDVNADRYNGRVRLQWYPGQYFANPASSPVGSAVKGNIFAEAPNFKDTMDFNGLAVMFARYEWKAIATQADADNNPFSGNIPQLQVSMLGVRVASLLVDAENTEYESAAVRYSTNPAEILLDYLRNPRYGKGLRNTDIHWPTWKAAARKCNQTVTYLSNQSITGPILTCNAVIPTDQTIFANVKTMLMGFRAYMPYVQGKYKLKIEDAGNEYDILSGSAVIYQTFTKDDMVGDVVYTGIERSSKYNVVAVNYVDPDQKFSVQQVIYPETEAERQVYIDKDGGRENKLEATFPTITNYAIAKDMARLLFNKSRRQETCSITVTGRALELEPGDNIRIQSNILNFGEDPWRIVSFKLNDDMTVELGCVRNPDDIYPYVRVGEEDYVIPLYIPKGSSIYYPGSENRLPLGLLPPTHAVFPEVYTATQTHPPATDPEGIGGGGPGGGNPPDVGPGPIIPEGAPETTPPITAPPTTPVPPTNNPVAPPPPPVAFDAVLSLKRTTAVIDPVNKSATFTIVFTQPTSALYERATFWWRLNRYSSWTEIQLTSKPGPGGEIPVTIAGLQSVYTTPYEYYVRTFASDGRASSQVLRGQFQLVQNQTTGAFIGAGSATVLTVSEGWQLPASEIPPTPVYNDDIDFLAIRPKLSGGVPQEPRRMSVSITQLQQVISKSLNSGLEGFIVYYRFKGDTYWSYERFKFAELGISPQQNVTVDLAGDFGSRIYPGNAIFTGNALQQYEFLVRLTYTNGTLAEKQLGPAVGPVEFTSVNFDTNGQPGYSFTTFGTDSRAIANVRSTAIPAGFVIKTVDEDPNRLFPVGSDIEPLLTDVFAAPAESKLQFRFKAPVNPKFRGYTIRYREVVPSENPVYTELVVPGAPNEQGNIETFISGGAYKHNSKFEWVITARYSLNGVTTDCVKSLYGVVSIPFGIASGTQTTLNLFNFKTIDTTLALGQLKTSFPGIPTVNPKAWIKKQVKPYSTGTSSNFGSYQSNIFWDGGSNFYLNAYYKFVFQPDATSTHIVVYRRVYDANGAVKTTTAGNAKYYGLGAWEKVSVALSSLATDSNGFKVVNVRGPLNSTMFDTYYETRAGLRLYDPKFGPTPSKYPDASYSYAISDVYPYFGVGNSFFGPTITRWCEFLFVLSDGTTEQTKGLLLRDFNTDGFISASSYKAEVDGFTTSNVSKDVIVSLSTLNPYQAGYKRNLNEAIPAIALNRLSVAGLPRASNYVTLDRFIQAPSNGDTVY